MNLTKPLDLFPGEVARIDAVRGFLCFYVFCFHFYEDSLRKTVLDSEFLRFLLFQGYVAVHIFFALSGFLILRSYVATLSQYPVRYNEVFFLRRIFRIFPAWGVSLLAIAVYRGELDLNNYLWNFFFLFGLQPFSLDQLLSYPSWSLYVEEIFYLCFPFFFLLLRKNLGLLLVISYVVLNLLFHYWVQIPKGMYLYTPINSFYYFFFGIGAYFLVPLLRNSAKSSWAFATTFVLTLFTTFVVKEKGLLTEVYILFWLYYIFSNPGAFMRFFTKLFGPIGKICFSFYLLHPLALWLPHHDRIHPHLMSISQALPLRLGLEFCMSLSIALLAGYILYSYVEKPFVQLGKSLAMKVQP